MTEPTPTPAPAPDPAAIPPQLAERLCVVITVKCDDDHVVGRWIDSISEKYPFYCNECDDDLRQGKERWWLDTQIAVRATLVMIPVAPNTVVITTPPTKDSNDL